MQNVIGLFLFIFFYLKQAVVKLLIVIRRKQIGYKNCFLLIFVLFLVISEKK